MIAVLWTALAWGGGSELYQSSYALEAAGDHAGALSQMDALAQRGDRSYVRHLRHGWLLYLTGDYARAVAAYRAAIEASPDSLEARQGVLLPMMALRQWKQAEAMCHELLGLAPQDYLGRSRLAWIRYSTGRFAEAAQTYQSVLGHYPSDVEMRAGLGWALLKAGDSAGARAAFAEVLRVAPSHASAAQGLRAAS